ncbi:lipid A ethanolaminephosphotransferase [Paucimonas lemoignei]|uniref:Lipid A ethanolaminephosphotransferase n=2 Tax=Paucimonas lemoignei TaxID=29443 RepID=A0A4V2UJ24_PAULE|nr:lipid A ethanolaminephosphotransferase [Paucimonas lemoignei]
MDSLFIASLFVILLILYSSFFLLIPGRRALKIVAICSFIIATFASYSADTYGIFIDRDMVRNLFETDKREVGALLNLRFFAYAALLGALPCFLILRCHIQPYGITQRLKHGILFLVGGTALCVFLVFAFSAHYSSFLRKHKPLRYLLTPAAAVQGTIQYARSIIPDAHANLLVDKTGTTIRPAANAGDKPLLMFLVVGETARAQNFQLGGYQRPTNPELSNIDGLFYFNNVSSCGTSTAISLPCMFSHLQRDNFSVSAAARTTNLLDALKKAGVKVEWRDNNSGSKGVSARITTITYSPNDYTDKCNAESCFDEVMLKGLNERINATREDTVLVFHQVGSHGPAYANRYPQAFEKFTPVCRTNELNECTDAEIRNAYDNTILYTDHNIAQQIKLLQSMSDRFDSLLIYVSDHGESLGEKSLYLHGAPYVFAPDEQKKVPFMVWMSDGYRKRNHVNQQCLKSLLSRAYSHDNLYHTVLGSMSIKNDVYNKELDIWAECRVGANDS